MVERARAFCADPAQSRERLVRKRDWIAEAHLFDLSDEAILAASRKVDQVVGCPDFGDLPFRVCWFRAEYCDTARDLDIVGYIATRDGFMGLVWKNKDGTLDASFTEACSPEGWDPHCVTAGTMLWLFTRITAGCVAERPSTRSFELRRELQKLRAEGVPAHPPEVYTIRIDGRRAGHLVRQAIEAHHGAGSGPTVRYEVRRHERMLVHRGRWPIDKALRDDFVRRGYTVEQGDRLDPRASIGLDIRGIEPSNGTEWIAWRFVTVKEHEAGPTGPLRASIVRKVNPRNALDAVIGVE